MTNRPPTSVALCTYNGAPFLSAQLDSLAAQTHPPFELVVSDDGSSDDTAGIIAEFARTAPFPVQFHRQPVNLGVTQNFAAAMAACRGDCIALCDQDDVWLPDKLAAAGDFFATHTQCLALFSDATLVDQSLRPLSPDPSLWRALNVTHLDRRRIADARTSLETLAGRFLVTGATLVIRRELLSWVLPIPGDLPRGVIHDAWIALVAAALGGLDSLPQSTMLYRQHVGQQMGLKYTASPPPPPFPRPPKGDYRQIASDLEEAHAVLAARLRAPAAAAPLAAVARRAAHYRLRAELPASRLARLWPVTCEMVGGRYFRYCRRPLLAAMRDVLF